MWRALVGTPLGKWFISEEIESFPSLLTNWSFGIDLFLVDSLFNGAVYKICFILTRSLSDAIYL